jgi:hypothetical protein
VFENRVLRRIFGPKKNYILGEWRKFHDEKLLNFCSSPNVINKTKARTIIRAGHVARMASMRTHTEFWSENLKGKDNLDDACFNDIIMLKIRVREIVRGCGLDLCGLWHGPVNFL